MLEIYDENGKQITWEELIAIMGDVQLHPRPATDLPGWTVACIQIHADLADPRMGTAAASTPTPHAPNAIGVNVTQDGRPVIGKKVAWYWPDALIDPAAGWLGRADTADTRTGDRGTVDLCMGPGAYYTPVPHVPGGPPAGGPHAVWIYGNDENSEMIQGLGMLAGTNHTHIDIAFAWTDPTTPDDLLAVARDIRAIAAKILETLPAMGNK